MLMGLIGDAFKSALGIQSTKIGYDPYQAAENVSQRNWASAENLEARRFTRLENYKNRLEGQRQFNHMRNMELRAIRNKVKDAKAAGIHPLYAMGVAGPGISPTFGGGSTPGMVSPASGSPSAVISESYNADLGSLISGLSAREERKLQRERMAQAKEAQAAAVLQSEMAAERDWAEAQLLRTRAARERTEANATGAGRLLSPEDVPKAIKAAEGRVEIKPGEIKATRPGKPDVDAGTNPLWRKATLSDGSEIYIPGEAIEDVDVLPALGALWKNMREWGKKQGRRRPRDSRYGYDRRSR